MAHSRIIEGRTFTGKPGSPAEFVLSQSGVTYRNCRFTGGSSGLVIQDSADLVIEGCEFDNQTGPADPAGHCLQLIRCANVSVLACKFKASPADEDLLSIYADKPTGGVTNVADCEFVGRGVSGSSTAACFDGPDCPTVKWIGGTISGARCGITIAGGCGHSIQRLTCGPADDATIYAYNGYGAAKWGPLSIQSCKLATPPLIDSGVAKWVTTK